MADKHSKETRSYNMSRIRGKNTKPELVVRKFLFSKGFRFRLHDPKLPGKPDVILPKYKTVIFINGCFWHGHQNCKKATIPKTRTDWWKEKIERNKLNDEKAILALNLNEWKVITVWQCGLKYNWQDQLLSELLPR